MIVSYWKGTDALTLVKTPPGKFSWRFRIYARRMFYGLFGNMFKEHWVDSKNLADHLIKFGIKSKIKLVPDKLKYTESVPKRAHRGFNILYYYPGDRNNAKFKQWLYGYDIYEEVRRQIPEANWYVVEGGTDLTKLFPIIDFYLRPTRHDGAARLRKECELQDIPVYWANKDNIPIFEVIESIKKVMSEKISNQKAGPGGYSETDVALQQSILHSR